jgi:type I restriction modification DNA specificity protein
MKENGIDWIGQIPEEWESGKVKYFSKISAGATPDRNNLLFWNGKINWMSSGEVNQEIVKYTAETITNLALKKSSTKLLPIGTVMLAMNGQGKTKGTVAILAIETASNQSLASFIVDGNRLNNQYLYYFFKAGYSYIRGLKGEDRDGLNLQLVSNITVLLFDIKEQQKIVDFLDKKTDQLDKAKNLLEEQIQKLKDYRASLIYETVTKGLDKTVPMKDSGIDWIGQVPEGWEITKHKYIMTKVKEICAHYEGQDILSLTRQGVVVRDIESGKGKMPASFDGYQFLEKGDLLFCLFDIDVTPRCVGVVENNGLTSSAYSRFRLDDKISVYYYYYLFLSMDEDKVLLHLAKNLRHSLTEDDFGIIETILPSYEEQLRIADYLGKVTKSIDEIVQLKQKQIDNINKQRQTLIYDYVTGKRRVY